MSPSHPMNLPETISAAAWLTRYDPRPTVLPRWPTSERMTLVAVLPPDAEDKPSVAYVITREEQLDPLITRRFSTLFFSVARAVVLAPEVRPATLQSEDWVRAGTTG